MKLSELFQPDTIATAAYVAGLGYLADRLAHTVIGMTPDERTRAANLGRQLADVGEWTPAGRAMWRELAAMMELRKGEGQLSLFGEGVTPADS